MGVTIKPSDLKFKYPRDIPNRDVPKFSGVPDPAPFNSDDLYEVIPVMEAAMDTLRSTDANILNMLEDILNVMPRFICTREEVYTYLVETARDRLNA
jgi:hypothetical protein